MKRLIPIFMAIGLIVSPAHAEWQHLLFVCVALCVKQIRARHRYDTRIDTVRGKLGGGTDRQCNLRPGGNQNDVRCTL